MKEVLVLPLIILGVYLLQYLFKGPEDNKQQPGPKRGQGGGPRTNPARPRRQVTDLDRFLEETRKRKQQEENKPVVLVEPINEPSLADTAERERKTAQARPRPPQPQRSGPRGERKPRPQPMTLPEPVRRPPLREQAAPVLLELAPSSVPARLSAQALPPPPAPPPVPATPAPPPAPTYDRLGRVNTAAALAPSQRKTTSPVLGELVRMLKKPQGVALAVILSEILDKPAFQRRG